MHEEKKEVIIEEPKMKKQKIDRFVLPVLPLPNPSEPFSKRQIFDYLYSRKITPGNCRNLDYLQNVLETVLSFKNITLDKLSESSAQDLETKVRSFTISIKKHWNKKAISRERLYGKFPNQMQDLFPWTPELKEN